MGDWDCYCAICGGPFISRAAFDDDNEDTINREWMEWDGKFLFLLGYFYFFSLLGVFWSFGNGSCFVH